MFGRRSKARQELEKPTSSDNASQKGYKKNQKDHKAELLKMFKNMPLYFTTQAKLKVAHKYRKLFIGISSFATDRDYKDLYEALIKGDPKLRSYNSVIQSLLLPLGFVLSILLLGQWHLQRLLLLRGYALPISN